MDYRIWIILILFCVMYAIWALIWHPKYSWRMIVLRHIQEALTHNRTPREFDEVIRDLSEAAGVPVGFAKEYLVSLSQSYGVPVGYILPRDRFAIELSVPKKSLPTKIAERKRLQGGRDRIDGENIEEFVTWEWYADHNPNLPLNKLRELAGRSDLSVAGLCRELYRMDHVGRKRAARRDDSQ